jgi:hypothetical protein
MMTVAISLAIVMALAVSCTFTAEEQSYAETLLEYKTAYIGDNSKVENLLDALHFDDGWERDTFELKTDERPYRLTINFNANAEAVEALVFTQEEVENPEPNPQPSLASESALMLFALIDNVDEVYFRFKNVDEISFGLPGTMDNNLNIDFDREWADETAKEDVRNFADTPEHLEELLAIQGCLGIFVGTAEFNPSPHDLTSRRRFQEAEKARRFLDAAKAQVEKPYALEADPPNSFNSFGLISYCLEQAGLDIPDMNCEEPSEYDDWMKIGSLKSVQPGDMLFFTDPKGRVDHAGIYIGNNRMIHASSSDGFVTKVSIRSKYWQSSFALARRAW